MEQIPCDAFRRNTNGSWTCVKPVTIKGHYAQARLNPGTTVSRGANFAGLNLVAILDKQCARR